MDHSPRVKVGAGGCTQARPCSSHGPQGSGHLLSYLREMPTLFCGLDLVLKAPPQVSLLLSAHLSFSRPSPMPFGTLIK